MRIKHRRKVPPRLNDGPDRRTRLTFKKHGKALADALAARAERLAFNSGRPWKHKEGRDFHTGLKRFLLRCIATVREMAR